MNAAARETQLFGLIAAFIGSDEFPRRRISAPSAVDCQQRSQKFFKNQAHTLRALAFTVNVQCTTGPVRYSDVWVKHCIDYSTYDNAQKSFMW
jgi:hypothetical protein